MLYSFIAQPTFELYSWNTPAIGSVISALHKLNEAELRPERVVDEQQIRPHHNSSYNEQSATQPVSNIITPATSM